MPEFCQDNNEILPWVYIVIPVYNRLQHTLKCLESLQGQTYKRFTVIVVDDNSTDGTYETIAAKYPEVVLVKGTGHLYWTGGTNRGVQCALERARDNDCILTLNNDTVVAADYLEKIVSTAAKHPGAIIGSLCVFMDDTSRIETSGFIMDWKRCVSRSLTKLGEKRGPHHTGLHEITHACGKGVLIPIRVFREQGLYDQDHFPHYHADSAFTLQAHLGGTKVILDYDAVVYSNVETSGMAGRSDKPTLRKFGQSFFTLRSPNYLKARIHFARMFFPRNRFKYLITIYIKTIGGFLQRYFRYHVGNLAKKLRKKNARCAH